MAVSPISYLGHGGGNYGMPDILKSALEGYEMSRKPAQMRTEEQRQKELVQQLQHGNYKAGLENEYLPHKLQNEQAASDINLRYLGPTADVDLRTKQAKLESALLELENPALFSKIPEVALSGLIEFYKEQSEEGGQPTALTDRFQELQDRIIHKRKLDIQRTEQLVGSHNFAQMTPEQKANVAAIANAAGIDQTTLNKGLMAGKSLFDIAEEQGISKEKLLEATEHPKYLATTGTTTKGQERAVFAAERGVVADFITDALSEYSNVIMGYSPKQIAEQIKGDNPKKQAKFLAARALGPEAAGMTAKMVGLPGGIRMMESIQSKALTDINVFRPFISPEVFREAQNYITDVTQKAFKESQKVAFSTGSNFAPKSEEDKTLRNITQSAKSPEQKAFDEALALEEKLLAQKNNPGGSEATMLYSINGERVRVPANEVPELREEAKMKNWQLEFIG